LTQSPLEQYLGYWIRLSCNPTNIYFVKYIESKTLAFSLQTGFPLSFDIKQVDILGGYRLVSFPGPPYKLIKSKFAKPGILARNTTDPKWFLLGEYNQTSYKLWLEGGSIACNYSTSSDDYLTYDHCALGFEKVKE
jgi:hypothetical protein